MSTAIPATDRATLRALLGDDGSAIQDEHAVAVAHRHGALLIEHGLGGWVARRLGERAPSDLRTCYVRTKQRNLLLALALAELGDRLQAIDVVVLKGMALLGGIYTDPGTRDIADIDLLLPSKRLAAVESILRQLGYRYVPERKWRANAFKRVWHAERHGLETVVELHTRLFAHDDPAHWQYAAHPTAGCKQLTPADLLVHLAGHLAYQHTFLKLSWLKDIDLLLRATPDLDWSRVGSLTQALRLSRALAAALHATTTMFATPSISPMPRRAPAWLMRCLNESFLWHPTGPSWRYLAVKHAMKSSAWDAIRYDLGWLAAKCRGGISA